MDLRIKKFKRIKEEILIKNLGRVNYFVGRNGCGKSSVLTALAYLKNHDRARQFFTQDSIVDLGGVYKIEWEWKPDPIYTDAGFQTPPRPSYSDFLVIISLSEALEYVDAGVKRIQFNYEKIEKKEFDFINQTLAYLNLNPLTVERSRIDDIWDDSAGKRVFKEGDQDLDIQYLAQGIKSFNYIRFVIENLLKQYLTSVYNPEAFMAFPLIIILVEEPENNLHPDLQKKIPLFLNEVINNIDAEINMPGISENIYFFVTTHSPFVISAAAKYSDHKVYLMDNGHLMDLEKNKTMASEGYNGSKCAWVVGQMLGSEVTDLGYPENYCLLEESSLQTILDKAKENNLIKNIEFVSISGVSKAESYNKAMHELETLNTLIKCNPYYADKYYMILDKLETADPRHKKIIDRLEKIRAKLGNRFIQLQETSLEEYYKNIDPELFEKANEEISKAAEGTDKGKIKGEYAKQIAHKIKTKEDFSRLFNNELDFLLK